MEANNERNLIVAVMRFYGVRKAAVKTIAALAGLKVSRAQAECRRLVQARRLRQAGDEFELCS